MNYQEIINEIYADIHQEENLGKVASYIPELGKINPEYFGVHLRTIDNKTFYAGKYQEKFSIQSIAKVISLSLAYRLLGGKIWSRLGVEPSGTPFNSLVQLESDKGIPRNPLINAGALVICDILISELGNAKEGFLNFIRDVSDNPKITYSQSIARSEKVTGFRNIALCNFIKSFNNIKNDVDEVLDFYFNLCSIELSCEELTRTFLFLANHGIKTTDNKEILNSSRTKRLNAIMLTCGFYNESGDFAFKVGLPGKSGVGGGIVAIHTNKYCIAVWGPRLNEKGNSYRGMKFLEQFTTKTASSIF